MTFLLPLGNKGLRINTMLLSQILLKWGLKVFLDFAKFSEQLWLQISKWRNYVESLFQRFSFQCSLLIHLKTLFSGGSKANIGKKNVNKVAGCRLHHMCMKIIIETSFSGVFSDKITRCLQYGYPSYAYYLLSYKSLNSSSIQ